MKKFSVAKTTTARTTPEVVPTAAVGPVSKEDMTLIQEILTGRKPAPNPFAAYIVEQMRSTVNAGQTVQQQLQAAQGQVRELQAQLHRLEGVQEQYLVDLQRWCRGTNPLPSHPEAAKNGAHEAPTA